MLTLFASGSVNGRRAVIGLLESGLPHRLVPVDLAQRPAALLAANPDGRVPTLVEEAGPEGRRFCLDQSGAILLYLAERAPHLLPEDARGRAEAHRWLLFHANDLGPAFISAYTVGRLAAPQDLAVEHFRKRVARFCALLDRRLGESPYLAGERFSIADCAVIPDIPWCLQDFEGLAGLANLRRWMEDVARRPAVAAGLAWPSP